MSAKRYATFKEKSRAKNQRHWKSEKYRYFEMVLASIRFTKKAER